MLRFLTTGGGKGDGFGARDRATITRSLLPYNMHDGESVPVEIGWMTLSEVA